MKAFSLIRKYIDWSIGNHRKDSSVQWVVYVWWPVLFYSICTTSAMCLLKTSIFAVVALTCIVAIISLVVSIACADNLDEEYFPQCFLPNWLPIILADITLLPLVGAVWFLKEIKSHTGLFVDASKRKLNFVSIDEFANGKFKKNRLQPYLFGRRKPVWNEKTILEIAREIVRDQIGRSLKDEEDSETSMAREIVAIEDLKINKENKTAQLCFSTTLCVRNGSDDKIEAGYYFVNLAFDEDLNAVDVSGLFFDSARGQKTKQERRRAFELYLANTSDDFGFGYDPLGLKDRKELFAESDFSPDVPVVPISKARVAE